MEIEINLKKTLDENATIYFEKSKKAKRAIVGLQKGIEANKLKVNQPKKEKVDRKLNWYEKFRWFISSDGLIVIGGKNAHQNEEIIKNYFKKEDLYFHAEVFGAPHCVVKTLDEKSKRVKKVPDTTKKEAAEFAVTFSKAFEQGVASADAYSVDKEQVSKRAPTGTSMGTGAFMIYGERNWFKKTAVSCAIGVFPKDKTLMCGPKSAIKKRCSNIIELNQGNIEKNVAAKIIVEKFKEKGFNFTNSEILSLLPNGNFNL